MSLQREAPTRRREPKLDDLDLHAEQEVDLRRYWNRITAHWWLPLVGLAIGLVVGLFLAVGGKQVYKAEATLSLGVPLTPTSNNQVPGFQTQPSVVREIVTSEAVIRRAAQAADLRPAQLRGKISTQSVGGARRVAGTQAPLYEISVTGTQRQKTARAANALAAAVVAEVSPYAEAKIAGFEEQLEAQEARIASLDKRIAGFDRALSQASELSPVEQLVLVTQVGNLEERRAATEEAAQETKVLLSLAENFERAQVLEPAVAFETTARSKRTSMLVGGLLGLLLGALAAVIWAPIAARRATR